LQPLLPYGGQPHPFAPSGPPSPQFKGTVGM
jgi:hypothetical protein